jgi:hypothetical protein
MSEHNAPTSEIFTAEINGNHYFVKKAPNLECVSEVLSKKFADELGVGEYVLPAKSFYTKGQDKGFVVMPLIPGIQTAFEAMKSGVELPKLDNNLVGKLETFDKITGNVDRHLNNVIFHSESQSYLLIDNALSFRPRGFYIPQRDLYHIAKEKYREKPLDTVMIKKAQDKLFYGLIDEAFSGFQQKTRKDKKDYYKMSIEDLVGKSNMNNQDSIIATAIAVKMDWCKRGTVGNGRGQCVPKKGERLRQAKSIAGGAFNAIDRSAGLIQKAAGTAAAIGVLNNLKTTVAKKPDPNAEKKSDSIATAIAMRMDWCKKGTVGNGRGQCVPKKGKQSKANKWMGRAVGGALLASPVVAPVAGYMALRHTDKKWRKAEEDLRKAEEDFNRSRLELQALINSPAGRVFKRRS